jgi:hypothetical protein
MITSWDNQELYWVFIGQYHTEPFNLLDESSMVWLSEISNFWAWGNHQ